MPGKTKWHFEADYLTVCNCDWGCPCNFNARPTQGNCEGWGAWRIRAGRFGGTTFDGVVFAWAFWWPGAIEQGNGVSRVYVDPAATPEQRKAIEEITSGRHGGGIFEIFPTTIARTYPTRVAKIELHIDGPRSWFRVDGVGEGHSDAIKYPDGTPIHPTFTLPHGIEFKQALTMNATRWWMRDEDLLAFHQNKYAAIATVKFSDEGCVG